MARKKTLLALLFATAAAMLFGTAFRGYCGGGR